MYQKMKTRQAHGAPNHERWLVSYADFITLLFAFFVVMFASSHADKAKAKQVSESVERAFEGPSKATHISRDKAIGTPTSPTVSGSYLDLQAAMNALSRELLQEIKEGKMIVRLERRGLIVSLNSETFFPSGEDQVDPSTYYSLAKVADAVSRLPNAVRLEGHTDSVPIHSGRFRNNWELSAARAIAVMDLLRNRWKIAADRLAITGYADTAPLNPDDTEAGRARNRRVDIVILSEDGSVPEPARKVS